MGLWDEWKMWAQKFTGKCQKKLVIKQIETKYFWKIMNCMKPLFLLKDGIYMYMYVCKLNICWEFLFYFAVSKVCMLLTLYSLTHSLSSLSICRKRGTLLLVTLLCCFHKQLFSAHMPVSSCQQFSLYTKIHMYLFIYRANAPKLVPPTLRALSERTFWVWKTNFKFTQKHWRAKEDASWALCSLNSNKEEHLYYY